MKRKRKRLIQVLKGVDKAYTYQKEDLDLSSGFFIIIKKLNLFIKKGLFSSIKEYTKVRGFFSDHFFPHYCLNPKQKAPGTLDYLRRRI